MAVVKSERMTGGEEEKKIKIFPAEDKRIPD